MLKEKRGKVFYVGYKTGYVNRIIKDELVFRKYKRTNYNGMVEYEGDRYFLIHCENLKDGSWIFCLSEKPIAES